jgi:glycosyltransferase involved in cell wall biosynthesis
MVKYLEKTRAKILHVHSVHDLPGPLAALFRGDSQLVLTPHFHPRINSSLGRLLFSVYRPMLFKLMEVARGIICVSEFEASLVERVFPNSAQKIRVIPNGIDQELLTEHSWREPGEPRLLYVGRLEAYKNVDKIMKALVILRKEHPGLALTVVGRGPLKPDLLHLAARLEITGNIDWIEGLEKSELYNLYTSSTIVVLPSDLEAFGLVAAEAIGAGAPTIVANSTGLSEFVKAGLALPIEPPVNEQKLASKILQVLESPREFSPKRKSSGLILSWDEVARRTFSFYESLDTHATN